MKNKIFNSDNIYPLSAILIVIVLWELVIKAFRVPSYILPAPSAIARLAKKLIHWNV
jgi:ABC-type nitrate/sulfonate/bicarbonate transport system permease component